MREAPRGHEDTGHERAASGAVNLTSTQGAAAPDPGSLLPWAGAVRPITDREFLLFQRLIYDATGIYLSPAKKALLVGRLSRRLRELHLSSFRAYYAHVTQGADSQERARMLECICTHETRFFREPAQFSFLEHRVLPEWDRAAAGGSRPRRVRVWCAGCSSGEEPYSVAMLILSRLRREDGWATDILATDLSQRVLAMARTGSWPLEKAKEIPPRFLRRFMLLGARNRAGLMTAGPEIRSIVRFEAFNLNQGGGPSRGPFDLIFCRNVLIYFDADSRRRAVSCLTDQLAPSGYLLLGHAESLNGITDRLHRAGPTVYGGPPSETEAACATGAASW